MFLRSHWCGAVAGQVGDAFEGDGAIQGARVGPRAPGHGLFCRCRWRASSLPVDGEARLCKGFGAARRGALSCGAATACGAGLVGSSGGTNAGSGGVLPGDQCGPSLREIMQGFHTYEFWRRTGARNRCPGIAGEASGPLGGGINGPRLQRRAARVGVGWGPVGFPATPSTRARDTN